MSSPFSIKNELSIQSFGRYGFQCCDETVWLTRATVNKLAEDCFFRIATAHLPEESLAEDRVVAQIDAPASLLKKWVVPYIAFSVVPDLSSFESKQEERTVLAVFQFLGFYQLTKELRPEIYAVANSFGADEWTEFFGNPGEVPPIPYKLLHIANKADPFNAKRIVGNSYTFVFMPKYINEKQLSEKVFFRLLERTFVLNSKRCKYTFYNESKWILIRKETVLEKKGISILKDHFGPIAYFLANWHLYISRKKIKRSAYFRIYNDPTLCTIKHTSKEGLSFDYKPQLESIEKQRVVPVFK